MTERFEHYYGEKNQDAQSHDEELLAAMLHGFQAWREMSMFMASKLKQNKRLVKDALENINYSYADELHCLWEMTNNDKDEV